MLLTETEARCRWCPLGRQYELIVPPPAPPTYSGGYQVPATAPGYIPSPAYNRKASGDVPACLASQCMAWRWGEPKILREIDLVSADVVDEQPRRGYCGAFGKPTEEE